MVPPSFELFRRLEHEVRPERNRVEPRSWQRQLIQLLRARLHERDPALHDVLLHAGPGAGKTLGALLAFQRMRAEGHLDHLVVFCHRTSIGRQWQSASQRLGVKLREWDDDSGRRGPEPAPDGWLLSYQGAVRQRERIRQSLSEWLAGRPWLAIADEVHHLGLNPEEPDAGAWGQVFTELTGPARLRLGLSGTPFRADSLAFCAARRITVRETGATVERIIPDLCVEPHRLILEGDVRPLEFRFQDGWVEHGLSSHADQRETSPLSQESRETWRARNLRRAIQPGDRGGIAQRLLSQARSRLERVSQGHPGAGGLVIARDITHAQRIARLLQEEGEAVLLVHSQDPEATANLTAFRGGQGRWLVSIDMCAEGFDAPRLRVVAYLSTVVTQSRFVQAITRAVRIETDRMQQESIPRSPSYVFAPADPLLITHARNWSRSTPYVLRSQESEEMEASSGNGSGGAQALTALTDQAGALIRMGGPQLPRFLTRPA